jgi:hypothetical protein
MATQIQFRRDTAANWTSVNPILASGELGLVTDTGAYKIGNGTDAWNTLPYNTMDNSVGVLTMSGAADPSTPSSGTMALYARRVAGHYLPKYAGPSGLSSPVQPAIFQNSLWLVQPNTTTSVSAVGGAVTSTGTISTITPGANTYGLCSNFVTAATAASTAGTGQSVAPLNTSTTVIGNGGFFCVQRLFFPDANYGTGATGARMFVGVTSNTLAVAVGADNPTGSRMGFSFSTNRGDTNWQFSTKDGTTENLIDTGMAFTVNVLYDFYVTMLEDGINCFWRIDDLTNSVTHEGTTTANLPASSTYMRGGFQIATLTTTARNVRMKKIYIETDN